MDKHKRRNPRILIKHIIMKDKHNDIIRGFLIIVIERNKKQLRTHIWFSKRRKSFHKGRIDALENCLRFISKE